MHCAESLRVQAYFDGEVDAVSAADIERHIEGCAQCRALLEELGQLRAALRRELSYASAPPALRARLMSAIDADGGFDNPRATMTPRAAPDPRAAPEPRVVWRARPFLAGAFSGMAGVAIAASLAFFLLVPPIANPLLDELVSAHVHSLMPDHLIDVASTDKHTVKPWFAGRADVSPVVADFEPQGYQLLGGRAEYFDHQRAAALVYKHGSHLINVFTWAASGRGLPENTTRDGYHLAFWRSGNLVYCAVSDTAWDELLGLAQLLQALGAQENR